MDLSMNIELLKKELRKKVHEEIAALPEEYVADSDKRLFLRVKSLKEFIEARNIMIYCSVEREPDTLEIAKDALSTGKTVAFPLSYKGGIMQARIVKDLSELQPAALGIPAPPEEAPVLPPEQLDIVIVPALTFDIAGYRLGYGGGYYDRYLQDLNVFTLGMARERLIKEDLLKEPHDIAVKCVVTEEKIRM